MSTRGYVGRTRGELKRTRGGALWTVAGIVGLLLIVGVALLQIPPTSVSPQGPRSEGGLDRTLEQALLDLEAARLAPDPLPPAVRIVVSDADLSTYLAAHAPGASLPLRIRNPQVEFRAGHLVATARARLLFVPVRLTARVTPEADRGRLRVSVEDLRLGLLPAPRRYLKFVAEGLHNAGNSVLHATDCRLEELSLTPGRLVIALRPPPR